MNVQFPDFRNLELSDKKDLEFFLDQSEPYSDFNFFSIWSNNTSGSFLISELNGNLVIRMHDYLTGEPFFTFLGNNEYENTVERLLKLSIAEKHMDYLKLIPDYSFPESLLKKYSIQEDRDNFDYIYSSEEMAKLEGSKFQNHRNFIHRFNNLHSNCVVTVIDLSDLEIQKSIIKLTLDWAVKRNKPEEETKQELEAIKRAISHSGMFNLCSVGVFDDKKMVGFMIGDLEHKKYCQTHFAKADTSYTGIYYVLYNFIAKQVLDRGYKYINNEQDLGIPGLRHSKVQWNPISYLKKYTIMLKDISH